MAQNQSVSSVGKKKVPRGCDQGKVIKEKQFAVLTESMRQNFVCPFVTDNHA